MKWRIIHQFVSIHNASQFEHNELRVKREGMRKKWREREKRNKDENPPTVYTWNEYCQIFLPLFADWEWPSIAKILGKMYVGLLLFFFAWFVHYFVDKSSNVWLRWKKVRSEQIFRFFFYGISNFWTVCTREESTQFSYTVCVKYLRYYLHLCSGSFGLVFCALSSTEKGWRALRIEGKVWTKNYVS